MGQLFYRVYIELYIFNQISLPVKPISVTNNSVGSRTAAATTCTTTEAPTLPATAVREPKLLYVTESGLKE